ncbi:MAG: sigma-70 family RNA polymerase sigma factor [Bacteroidales bacterium]|nr:sigma-70 family RNA polymerase sigma factor [Bacteroidales bacterium]
MEENSIISLVESCKKGDRGAQKSLYERLSPRMFAVCLRYSGSDRQQAEDWLQDGFVTLFSKLDSYKGEGAFEGWARKIFVNTALMDLRKKDALKDSGELDEVRGMMSDIPSQTEDIGYKELMALLAAMPAGFRTVFNMYVVEGYSHKEIAEALGISEVTSRSQLARARTWMQERIKARH